MSTSPCGDQTQKSCCEPLRYAPSTTSCDHSTRIRFIRHSSPGFGGIAARVCCASSAHGKAASTLQPASSSLGSFSVPSMWIAVRRPGRLVGSIATPPSAYGLGRVSSQIVPSGLISNS
jgi:hypothetical protein